MYTGKYKRHPVTGAEIPDTNPSFDDESTQDEDSKQSKKDKKKKDENE